MKNLIIAILVLIVVFGCSQNSAKKQETLSSKESASSKSQNGSFEFLDSASVNSMINKLQGIEKYAVKDNYYTFAKLLKFKDDEKNYQGIIKLLGTKEHGYIENLDRKNGFIVYNDSHKGDRVITVTYWNKSDGSKLVGTVDAFSDGMALESSISFELFHDGNYVRQELRQIIPELKSVYGIVNAAIPEDLEFYSNSWVLPNSGKNINYCVENECVELLWNDGVFLISPEDK